MKSLLGHINYNNKKHQKKPICDNKTGKINITNNIKLLTGPELKLFRKSFAYCTGGGRLMWKNENLPSRPGVNCF